MRRGTTLLELIVCLLLLSVAAGLAAPHVSLLRDRVRVRAVREEVVGLITETRREALLRGGARAVIGLDPPSGRIEATGGATLRTHRFGFDASGGGLTVSAGRDPLELPFDGMGIGRFASATIVVRSGEATARVRVASYGRVRRR